MSLKDNNFTQLAETAGCDFLVVVILKLIRRERIDKVVLMYKYLKLLVIILLLIIVSSCKKDNTLVSLNSTVHNEKMTLKSETNNTAVEIISTAVPGEYSQKEVWFYDFNNDGFLEMLQISDSGLYQYSIYDLSGDEPSYIGDFFLNDDVYGTVCKIYRCYDMESDEMFCVTEEIFKRLNPLKYILISGHGRKKSAHFYSIFMRSLTGNSIT